MTLKAGDIILSRNGTIGSGIIRWWTQSDWSHARVMINATQFVESAWPRVRIGEILELKGAYIFMTPRFPLTDAAQFLIERSALQYVGKRFDILGLLSFFLRVKVQNKSWFFCSELVAEVFEKIGQPLLRKSPAQVTPQDIFQSFEIEEAV